jgi:transcriptional regulator with XRE-family HTH domain
VAVADGRNIDEQFGKRVRIAMAVANVSCAELARLLGVSRSAVSAWANGIRYPTSSHLLALADMAGVSLDWMMARTELDFITRVPKRAAG